MPASLRSRLARWFLPTFSEGFLAAAGLLWLPVLFVLYEGGRWWDIALGLLLFLLPEMLREPLAILYLLVLPALALTAYLAVWASPRQRQRFRPHFLTHAAALAVLLLPVFIVAPVWKSLSQLKNRPPAEQGS